MRNASCGPALAVDEPRDRVEDLRRGGDVAAGAAEELRMACPQRITDGRAGIGADFSVREATLDDRARCERRGEEIDHVQCRSFRAPDVGVETVDVVPLEFRIRLDRVSQAVVEKIVENVLLETRPEQRRNSHYQAVVK